MKAAGDPVPNTPDNVMMGKGLYAAYCSPCHGPKFNGNVLRPFTVLLAVPAAVVGGSQGAVDEVREREVGDRVAPRLEEQDGAIALHHRAAAELGPRPAPERLGVEHSLRHPGHEEPPVGVAAQRPLLP